MRILIIRHGDPDYANDTLTEKGHREASLLAQKLKNEKIDHIFCSPLGRAKDTCAYTAKALGKENEVVIHDWLQEFGTLHYWPDGTERHILWDMLPEFWTKIDKMYAKDEWLDQDFYRDTLLVERYKNVTDGLDELLKNHGYTRNGRLYKTEQGNHDTIALFCHFGLEAVLLSHLCNISPIVLTHHFCARTSSVTTLYTEEREKGKAVFRCVSFGDTGHLYAGEEEPSFSARFCEVYEDETRHD
jgi:probable phosphoglycerate mutase